MREYYRIEISIEEKMPDDHIIIQCQSQPVGARVMSKLDDMTGNEKSLVVKQEDDYVIVKREDIIFAEVYNKELTIYTKDEEFKTTKSLSALQEDLRNESFVQASKSSLLNIHSIKRVEPSFSGNLLAHLSNEMKVSISRRFVVHLKEKLGI